MSSAPAKQQVALTLAYDGTGFLGWQETKMGPSIEQTVRELLEQLLQEPVVLEGASRTDGGVHARGQLAAFTSSRWHEGRWDGDKLRHSLNRMLPGAVRIIAVEEKEEGFHPTLSCKSKEYHYQLSYALIADPHERLYCWHTPCTLDLELMKEGAKLLVGEKDFSAFCNASNNPPYSSTVRRLYRVELMAMEEGKLLFIIQGNSFLYKMARNIVGTLLYLGCGKLQLEEVGALFNGSKRCDGGITAPAHGLFLHKLYY